MGSGTGKVVLQVYMQVPQLFKAVGIELSPTRHAAAARALEQVSLGLVSTRARLDMLSSESVRQLTVNDDIHLLEGDLFSIDLSDATHIWIASLCFPRDMMEQLAHKIVKETRVTTTETATGSRSRSTLQCIATLQASPLLDEMFGEPRVEFVEMTWTKPRGGASVYFYDTRQT